MRKLVDECHVISCYESEPCECTAENVCSVMVLAVMNQCHLNVQQKMPVASSQCTGISYVAVPCLTVPRKQEDSH